MLDVRGGGKWGRRRFGSDWVGRLVEVGRVDMEEINFVFCVFLNGFEVLVVLIYFCIVKFVGLV